MLHSTMKFNILRSTRYFTTSSTKPLFFITTPIFYVNGEPHIGHAYTTLYADAIARYKRLCGENVHFSTGTDEHGMKVYESSIKNNMKCIDFCTNNSNKFKTLFKSLNISYDDYIRTTEQRHKETVKIIWNNLLAKGYIYKSNYEGWYSKIDEAFVTATNFKLSEADGIAYSSTGEKLEWVKEENYKFKLSLFQNDLSILYKSNSSFITPHSRQLEIETSVNSGLYDISISRLESRVPWGIPVPNDPSQTMYVWFEALINYLSTINYPNNLKLDRTVNIVGKDILSFHSVMFPALLLANDIQLNQSVIAHGHFLNKNIKMSKSLGNVIDPNTLLTEFGLEAVRYSLLKTGGFEDTDFSIETVEKCFNAELADTFGNLISRTLTPKFLKNATSPKPTFLDFDSNYIKILTSRPALIRSKFESFDINKAIGLIIEILWEANKFFTESKPWALTDENRRDTVIYLILETIRICSILLQPVIPNSTSSILDKIGVDKDKRLISFATFQGDNSFETSTNKIDLTKSILYPKAKKL